MIRYLHISNFRAFREQVFPFSRINIFVGPNNSGKSSAISAINLVAQTVKESVSDVPILLRGKYEDLGTFLDTVHGNNPRTKFSLEFGINEYKFKYEFKYRTQRREIEIVFFELLKEDESIFLYKSGKDSYQIKYISEEFENIFPGVQKKETSFQWAGGI